MGGGRQRHAPADLPPGKTRYPLYRRLGRPHGRSGRVRKISPPPGFDPRTVQPVASRYIDWAIPALNRKHEIQCNSGTFVVENYVENKKCTKSLGIFISRFLGVEVPSVSTRCRLVTRLRKKKNKFLVRQQARTNMTCYCKRNIRWYLTDFRSVLNRVYTQVQNCKPYTTETA